MTQSYVIDEMISAKAIAARIEALAVEITRAEYHRRLERALAGHADFTAVGMPTAQGVIQRNTQTS